MLCCFVLCSVAVYSVKLYHFMCIVMGMIVVYLGMLL